MNANAFTEMLLKLPNPVNYQFYIYICVVLFLLTIIISVSFVNNGVRQ